LPRVLNVSSAGRVQTTSVSDWIDSGIKPCFRVTTRTGRRVEVTGHHPFLTVQGWKPLHDLDVDAHIAVPRAVPVFGEDEFWPLDRVRLLAYFIAEGGLTGSSPKWSNADSSLVEDFRESLARQFPDVVVKQDGSRSCDYKVVRPDRGRGMGPNPVTAWLRDLGLMGKYAGEKSFPSCVWKWSRRYLAEFVRVVFSCNGTIYRLGNYPRIEFSVSSERLARDVHHALTRFGIVAKLWRKKERCWRVEITAPNSVLRFQAEIGWMGEKALRFAGGAFAERQLPKRGSNYGHPPREVWDLVRAAAESEGLSLSELGRLAGETTKTGKYAGYNPHTDRNLPSYRLAKYAEMLGDEELMRAASPDLLWDEIVSIEPIGEHRVYDLTVPDGSNFIAEDVCVHNTALALNIIWHASGAKGLPVAIFSLEMSKEQLVQRLISQTTRIPTQALRSGNVRAEDWPKLVRGVAEVSRAPIWIDDTAGVTLMEIRAKVRRLSSQLKARGEEPLSLVVVDYLQLMVGQNNRSENRQQEIAEISRGLKVLARDLDVPVLAVAQLSRAVEQRHDKRPLLSDLRDCVTGDTMVLLANGKRVPVRELVGTTPRVLAMSPDGGIVEAQSERIWSVGRRPVFTVRLASGRRIRATARHRLFGADGWIRVGQLRPGDRLAIARSVPEPARAREWPEARLALLGHLIGDGSYLSGQPLRYCTASEVNSRLVAEAARSEFGVKVNRHPGRGNWHQLVFSGNGNRWHPAGINLWLRDLGIFDQRSFEKQVPQAAFELNNRCIALLLRHLWATDGTIFARRPGVRGSSTICFLTNSRRLAEDVAALLLRLAIVARIREVLQGKHRTMFAVSVSGAENQKRFLELVGTFGACQTAAADQILRSLEGRTASTNVDTHPVEFFGQVKASMAARGISHRAMAVERGISYGDSSRFRFAPSRTLMAEYAEILDDDVLRTHAKSGLFWDRVVEVTASGEEEVFDLTVPGPSSWLADGVVSHNSGAIEQDADMVMFLYRDEYYNSDSDDKGIAEIIIGKHRNGPTGKVQLAWMEQYTKFASLARRV
jgi:replicative DNA helicase